MKKLVSLICCILLLAILSAGCKNNESANPKDTSTGEVDTSDLYDEDGYLKDSIPDNINYGGATVKIMAWNAEGGAVDFDTTDTAGDQIASETYTRNDNVQDRLNVEFDIDISMAGNNADRYNYVQAVERNIGSGIAYDLIACYSMCSANFAADGFIVDLKQYQGILDLEKPWWSSKMLESSTINDKLYFASGSISASSILQTLVLAVNMKKVVDYDLEDPRQLTLDGKWTMAKFYEMCANKWIDTNTEIEGKDAGDNFGFAPMDDVIGDGFLASNGLHYLSTDESGKIVIAPDFKGEHTYNLSRDLIEKFKTNDYLYDGAKHGAILREGRSLFFACTLEFIKNNRNEMDYSYGYVPYPKANEDQKDYYSACGFPYTMWSITTVCKDGERAAYVMEALASEGYRTVQPEVYENLKYRGNSDPLNAKMFDLIIESKTYDIGRIFHNMFKWGDSPVAAFRSRMYNYDNDNWYSALANTSQNMQGVIDNINTSFGY